MKKIIIFLLFFPTLVFAFDCDKGKDSYTCEYKIDGLSSSDFGQKGLTEIQSNSDGFLDSLNIIACIPKGKKLLFGQFAYPDTVLTCYATSQTTFEIRLSQLYNAGFRISKIENSGTKVLYYMEK